VFAQAFYVRLRIAARRELRHRGLSARQVTLAMDAADDATCDQAVVESGVSLPVGAFGDGSIIQAIVDFLKSEEGQKLIQALIALILSVLG
jgi:hypothetical protein